MLENLAIEGGGEDGDEVSRPAKVGPGRLDDPPDCSLIPLRIVEMFQIEAPLRGMEGRSRRRAHRIGRVSRGSRKKDPW